jgi:hypothetical protein
MCGDECGAALGRVQSAVKQAHMSARPADPDHSCQCEGGVSAALRSTTPPQQSHESDLSSACFVAA